jgi:hypothetical protein
VQLRRELGDDVEIVVLFLDRRARREVSSSIFHEKLFADVAKVRLGAGVRERLGHLFVAAGEIGNFGNARYARSIFEQSYANMATRALADGRIERGEVDELLVADSAGRSVHDRRAQDRARPTDG